jgi:hypothetical protein
VRPFPFPDQISTNNNQRNAHSTTALRARQLDLLIPHLYGRRRRNGCLGSLKFNASIPTAATNRRLLPLPSLNVHGVALLHFQLPGTNILLPTLTFLLPNPGILVHFLHKTITLASPALRSALPCTGPLSPVTRTPPVYQNSVDRHPRRGRLPDPRFV